MVHRDVYLYMFDEKGQIIIDKEECDMDADDLMMLALDAGAEDFADEEDSFEIRVRIEVAKWGIQSAESMEQAAAPKAKKADKAEKKAEEEDDPFADIFKIFNRER